MVLFGNTNPPVVRDPLVYGDHPYNIGYLRSHLKIETICKIHEILVYKDSPLNRPKITTDTTKLPLREVTESKIQDHVGNHNNNIAPGFSSIDKPSDVWELLESQLSNKTAHFIYFDVGHGGDIASSRYAELYQKNINIFVRLHPDWTVLLWSKPAVHTLIKNRTKQLMVIWKLLEEKVSGFYQVDFAKCVVLRVFGGVYVDLDLEFKEPLVPNTQYIYASKKGQQKKRKITNSLVCLNDHELYDAWLQYIITKYFTCGFPQTWDRHLLHTVGALSYAKFCKFQGLQVTHNEQSGLVRDHGTCAWVNLNRMDVDMTDLESRREQERAGESCRSD
jgi:hypothetical protein